MNAPAKIVFETRASRLANAKAAIRRLDLADIITVAKYAVETGSLEADGNSLWTVGDEDKIAECIDSLDIVGAVFEEMAA